MRICAAQPGSGGGDPDVAVFDCGFWCGGRTLGCCGRRCLFAGTSLESEKYGSAVPATQREMEPAATAFEESEVAEFRLEAKG